MFIVLVEPVNDAHALLIIDAFNKIFIINGGEEDGHGYGNGLYGLRGAHGDGGLWGSGDGYGNGSSKGYGASGDGGGTHNESWCLGEKFEQISSDGKSKIN